jgi:pyrroloquinoline quinone (PQQ) biosynthesis protein C
MERTQISLDPGQADLLRRLARARGVSMARLIRDAVDQAYGSAVAPPPREDLWARAADALGSAEGDGEAVAVEHDRHLDEAYGA